MTEEFPTLPHRQSLTVLPDRATEIAPQAASPVPVAEKPAEVSPASGAQPGELPAAGPPAKVLTHLEKKLLEGQVIKAIRQIYDPEIPVNIHDLGLIYGIDVDDTGGVKVRMTLTAPACPVAGSLPGEVETKIETIPEVRCATVELVWEPAWSKDMMSELAKMTLDMF